MTIKRAPDILYSPTSPLKGILERTRWETLSVGPLDGDTLGGVHHANVLLLSRDEADRVWADVESYALTNLIYPLLVADDTQPPAFSSVFLEFAPVTSSLSEGELEQAIRSLLQDSGRLHRDLVAIDGGAQSLVENSLCEWVRSSVGIVGLIKVRGNPSAEVLVKELEQLRRAAHGTVDRVASDLLSTEDLWALLLVASIPWTRQELAQKDKESGILRDFVSNTIGSRKVVMCADESILELLGPVAGKGSPWHPTSDDPLRDELGALALDERELTALDLLFKRRFSVDDVDYLIATLSEQR